MNKVILKIDSTFFEIEKHSNKEISIKVVKDPLEQIYTDIPCLYADTTGEHSGFLIFDKNENDDTIEAAGGNLLGSKSYFTLVKNIQDKKVAWYIKKTEAINLFKEFAFNKIIPLDIFLLKANKGLAGVVSDGLSYLRRFKDIFSLVDKDTVIFDTNSDFNFFLGLCEDIYDIDKAILTDKIVTEEIKQQYNFETLTWKQVENFINGETRFVLIDKYSENYQSKIYRKLLLFVSAVMFSVSPYLIWKYYQNKAQYTYYETLIQGNQNLLNEIKHKEKKYKTDLIYKWYKPVKFENFYDRISEINENPGIFSVIYSEKNTKRGIKSVFDIKIEGLNNFKTFYKKYKDYITGYKIGKDGNIITVQVERSVKK